MTAVRPRHQRPKRPLTERELAQRREAGKAKKPNMRQTEAALAQRRAASAAAMGHQTGPITEEGKAISSRNAWKHGQRSAVNRAAFTTVAGSLGLSAFGKPCRTTCPVHPDNPDRSEAPCSLVKNQLTQAGGDCLDKTVYLQAFEAIIDAVENGDMSGMNAQLAANLGANLQLLHQIRHEIATKGLIFTSPMVDKEGNIVREDDGTAVVGKVHQNPAVFMLIRLTEALGLSLPETLATPRSREKVREADEAGDTLQQFVGAIAERFNKASARTPRTIDHDAG